MRGVLKLWTLLRAVICLLVAGLLLVPAGCAPTPTSTAMPTDIPTEVPESTGTVEPTATLAGEPTVTPTTEPTATATPPPTSTATPEPTATATETAQPTMTPTPEPTFTPEPTATAMPTATSAPTATPTRPPTATPKPVSAAWRAEYWSNADLIGSPALIRSDPAIDFAWADGAPASEVPADEFSARWTRVTTFGEGMYDFHATMDDGMRVYVDDKLVIDEWRDEGVREVTASLWMSAGSHSLKVEYYDRRHQAQASLWWEPLRQYAGWRALYWTNPDLRGNPVLIRDDPNVIFDWGLGGPGGKAPVDNFSARWTRVLNMEEGTYRFSVFVDDGVRMWVDGQQIIDAWADHELRGLTADYVIAGRGKHTLQVEYYDSVFDAKISVNWARSGSASYPYWKGEYWSNSTLSGDPLLVRSDRSVNQAWGRSAPAPGLPADGFSVRWTRKNTLEAGAYRFHFVPDDGIRFYVDGDLLLDEWHKTWGEEHVVDVNLNGEHDLKIELYEEEGDARLEFWWERTGN